MKNDLMIPRWEVVALWPNTLYSVGDVVESEYRHSENEKFFNEYPHLFRKLSWWEKRKPEEMPEYVKVVCDDVENIDNGGIVRVKKWFTDCDGDMCFNVETDELGWNMSSIEAIPATEQEYNEYTNP